jgi:hypothetical protein
MFALMGFMADNVVLGSVLYAIYNFGFPLPITVPVMIHTPLTPQ